jgi:uncharacterized membrane protein
MCNLVDFIANFKYLSIKLRNIPEISEVHLFLWLEAAAGQQHILNAGLNYFPVFPVYGIAGAGVHCSQLFRQNQGKRAHHFRVRRVNP